VFCSVDFSCWAREPGPDWEGTLATTVSCPLFFSWLLTLAMCSRQDFQLECLKERADWRFYVFLCCQQVWGWHNMLPKYSLGKTCFQRKKIRHVSLQVENRREGKCADLGQGSAQIDLPVHSLVMKLPCPKAECNTSF
jgi:hypothetical protein